MNTHAEGVRNPDHERSKPMDDLPRRGAIALGLRFGSALKAIGAVLFLHIMCAPAHARWAGEGEVVGKVLSARSIGMRGVVFQVAITHQTIERGPQLGSPCPLLYKGPGQMEVSRGDQVKLRVRGGGDPGIRVEKLEFVVNEPGTADETTKAESRPAAGEAGLPDASSSPSPRGGLWIAAVFAALLAVLGGVIRSVSRRSQPPKPSVM
jgi:hypothetical protein